MYDYKFVTNFTEIIAGTNNTISPLYQEAVKTLDTANNKTKGYIKNFMTSIEAIASKSGSTDKIVNSKGNITQFSGYKDINDIIQFLNKNASGVSLLSDLITIERSLEQMKDQYIGGYDKQLRLIMLEYESALYLLVTGLAMIMSSSIDLVQKGTDIKVTKKASPNIGIIDKLIQEMAKELSTKTHKDYLVELLSIKNDKTSINKEIKEQTIVESYVSDTLDLIDSIFTGISKIGKTGKMLFNKVKNSMFGIIPLIRSALYLKYKKKADTVLALEQQAHFIELNIEQLKNIQKMDPEKKEEIIQKQQAVVENYRKKADKLRAQLTETEKDTAAALKADDVNVKKDSSDDFILESHDILYFAESVQSTKLKVIKEIKDAAKSMIDDLIETQWSNLELKASVEDDKRSINFLVDINGKRKDCMELADNKIIDKKEMEKSFDIFSKQVKKLPDYVKGSINKIQINDEKKSVS